MKSKIKVTSIKLNVEKLRDLTNTAQTEVKAGLCFYSAQGGGGGF